MNFVVFGLILICCHAGAIEIDDNFAAIQFAGPKINLENFFEKFKSLLKNGTNGLKIYGIPICDPFIVNKLPIKYNLSTFVDNIDFKGFLEHFNVSSLASYIVNSAKFKPFDLNAYIDISWPLIIANTNYSFKGNILNYDVYGGGDINGTLYNFRIIMNVDFNLKNKHMQVQNIETKTFLEALDFNATAFCNDKDISEIFSKTISDVTSKFTAQKIQKIAYIINNIVIWILNKFLLTMTFPDLLKVIGL
ncbi:PREDICTED: uncharacterized protein LOC108694724 [Atta colombica]|uniref:uncharacterized protein LOC108694724 n=1 Tax=Atta colombica TaxID=520822 RepID=UPI00084C5E2A|nr:PREDICTED: uncharacterized protein LOC108694724 [Atta colombica]